MASAWLRHQSAQLVFWAFTVGAFDSAADRSQCVAASLNCAAERGHALGIYIAKIRKPVA